MKIDLKARPRRAILWGELLDIELGVDEPDELSLRMRVDDLAGDLPYLRDGGLPADGTRMSIELSWLAWPPKREGEDGT